MYKIYGFLCIGFIELLHVSAFKIADDGIIAQKSVLSFS